MKPNDSNNHYKGLKRLLNDMNSGDWEDDAFSDRVESQFEKDANEGFDLLSDGELASDVQELNQQLNQNKKFRWAPFLLKAAAVLLLIAIPSVLFWTLYDKSPLPEIAQNKVEAFINDSVISKVDTTDNALADMEINDSYPFPAKPVEKSVSMNHIAKNFAESHGGELIVEEEEFDAELQVLLEKVRMQQNHAFRQINSSSAVKRKSSDSPVVQEILPISGTVYDEQGMPMPGVSVIVKGGSKGSITDMNGMFTLVPSVAVDTAKLVISFIGYETEEVAINNIKDNSITMEPSLLALDEVVVVGYSVQKKSMLTGSVMSIDSEEEKPAYIAASPPEKMDKYIAMMESRLVYPADGSGKKVSVQLQFVVDVTGKLKDIVVLKSPGDSYRDEAIRVMQSSPLWKPATNNGFSVEDKQKLRLVFYPPVK